MHRTMETVIILNLSPLHVFSSTMKNSKQGWKHHVYASCVERGYDNDHMGTD